MTTEGKPETPQEAHCICSEAYGVGPEKCGARVHHKLVRQHATQGDSAREPVTAHRLARHIQYWWGNPHFNLESFLTQHTRQAVAQARVDEAQWWMHARPPLAHMNSSISGYPDSRTDCRCIGCNRMRDLAAIAKESTKTSEGKSAHTELSEMRWEVGTHKDEKVFTPQQVAIIESHLERESRLSIAAALEMAAKHRRGTNSYGYEYCDCGWTNVRHDAEVPKDIAIWSDHIKSLTEADVAQARAEHDRELLKQKELDVANHIRAGIPDGCMCEPCIAGREHDRAVREKALEEAAKIALGAANMLDCFVVDAARLIDKVLASGPVARSEAQIQLTTEQCQELHVLMSQWSRRLDLQYNEVVKWINAMLERQLASPEDSGGNAK